MSTTILPNDDHYLAITFICVFALNIGSFTISYTCGTDKLTDFIGSFSFILCALLSLCANGLYTQRQLAVTILTLIARFELAGYLFYRVLKRGRDERFDAIRGNFFAFLVFWIFQIIWSWGVCLPVIYVNAERVDPPFGESRDIAGIVIFTVCFLIQVIADFQKDAFRGDPKNKGKPCDAGVWSWSRHPNFFGEIMMWWGMYILCAPVFEAAHSWGWATIVSPLLTFVILMFGSGMPTAEGDNQKRFMKTQRQKELFLIYRNRTSPLIPFPPFLYARLPLLVKRIFFFELPMYETDWSYCGETATSSSTSAAGGVATTVSVSSEGVLTAASVSLISDSASASASAGPESPKDRETRVTAARGASARGLGAASGDEGFLSANPIQRSAAEAT